MDKDVNFFTPKQILECAKKNAFAPFNVVDQAIILTLGHSYLSLLDLSVIKVSDVLKPSGEVRETIEFSGLVGESKCFWVKEYLAHSYEMVVAWRISYEHGVTNLSDYGSLDPESPFFLNSNGVPYKLQRKEKDNKVTYNAYGLRQQFDKYVLPIGCTPSTLNDSFLKSMWKVASETKPAAAIPQLQQITGLTPPTIKKKVYREPMALETLLQSIF